MNAPSGSNKNAFFILSGGSKQPENYLQAIFDYVKLIHKDVEELKKHSNGRAKAGEASRAKASHSDDFRSVNWYGLIYEFTGLQARCLECLWVNWANGTPVVADATILDAAGSDQDKKRLDHVFRGHPAWNSMIVSGTRKGTRRLKEPGTKK